MPQPRNRVIRTTPRSRQGVLPIGDQNGPGPTNEKGWVVNEPLWMPDWGTFIPLDDLETNEKLTFPQSVLTYHGMLADPQIQGLRTGTTWPIFRMNWYLDDNNAKPEIVERISADHNLPIGSVNDAGEPPPQRRTRNRFNFLQHLEEAADAIFYGFKVFEEIGYIGKDGLWHLRKLADRPVQTIDEIKIARDGGIVYVRQMGHDPADVMDINRLVVYPFQKRGANWHGRSLLRGCYGPWMLKDRAMRVGVMNIQRAGVGTPVIQGHPGASDSDLQILDRMAQRFVAGDRSGGAIPYGAILRLVGVEGTQPDAVGFVKLMNEEMGRAFFQMFMNLGQTTSGSRALGTTFVDYHKLVIEYLAQWFARIYNEHVIEDDLDFNEDEDEEYAPLLCWEWAEGETEENPEGPQASENPTSDLARRIRAGLIDLPEDIRAEILDDDLRRGGVASPRSRRRTTRVAGSGQRSRSAISRSPAEPPTLHVPLRRNNGRH